VPTGTAELGTDEPSVGVVAPAGDDKVAAVNAPMAATAATEMPTRLAACRMDIVVAPFGLDDCFC
jgi:hypothetical protein